MIRSWLHTILSAAYHGHPFEIMVPPNPEMGDYSVNLAFVLAKQLRRPPMEVAQQIADRISADPHFGEFCSGISVAAPGYVNLALSSAFLQKSVATGYASRHDAGKSRIGAGRRVIVEYCSTNVAKPLHIGHIRTMFIGDALANIFEALGYDVVRWDHVGDWGTQFGKLIAAYKLWGDERALNERPLEALLDLYVRYSAAAKEDAALEDRARVEFKKLEDGDAENVALWRRFKDESLREAQRTYQALGKKDADQIIGEGDYQAQLEPLVQELMDRGIAERSEGAVIVRLDEFSLPPALLQKSDGASLYLTRDLASLRFRLERFSPAKILYVVGNEQSLHFDQLFAVAQKMRLPAAELVHVKFGLILGEDRKKFATREGKLVPLDEVLTKITELAHATVRAKNPDLPDDAAAHIARVVGVGALKYNDLRESRTSDVVFDWAAMLDLRGNSGPYLQYTYARCASIVRKAGGHAEADPVHLTDPAELALARHLLEFQEALVASARTYTTNGLALYLYELANRANRFYENVRVTDDENAARRAARVMLVETVLTTLGRGLEILGIGTLPRI